MSRPLAVIVLAAGLGKRTRVSTPKVLLPLCGQSLIETVLGQVAGLGPDRTVVVLHHGRAEVERVLAGRPELTLVDQGEPHGTGHAVQVAARALGDFDGDVLVTYGDMPLLRTETLAELRAARGDAAAVILTGYPDDPGGLGRILRDADGELIGVREERDCSDGELSIDEVNVGVYCYDGARLGPVLGRLGNANEQAEYYLTDTVHLMLDAGERLVTAELADSDESLGVNSLWQLAAVRAVMQERILLEHLDAGVLIEDPATTFIDHGVRIGAGTRILPCTVIRRGVEIGAGCEVGPFAHLRPGAVLEDTAEIGNFVEVKASRVGRGTKAKHLTYLGDCMIGADANIGAGTITANYDGIKKHRTVIGERAFVGSGTVLVAPSEMAGGSMTGAGAIVTRGSEIAEGEVWVGIPARPIRRREDRGGGGA